MADEQTNVDQYGVPAGHWAPNENDIFKRTLGWLTKPYDWSSSITTKPYDPNNTSNLALTRPVDAGESNPEASGGINWFGGNTLDANNMPINANQQQNVNLQDPNVLGAGGYGDEKIESLMSARNPGSKWTPFQNIKEGKGLFGKEAGFGSGKGKIAQGRDARETRKELKQQEQNQKWNPVDAFEWTKEYGDYGDRNKAAYESMKDMTPEEMEDFQWEGMLGGDKSGGWDARDEHGFKINPTQFKEDLQRKWGEMKSPADERTARKASRREGLLGLADYLRDFSQKDNEAYKYEVY